MSKKFEISRAATEVLLEAIAKKRKTQNLTMDRVMSEIGITDRTYYKLIKDKARLPRYLTVLKIQKWLGLPVARAPDGGQRNL